MQLRTRLKAAVTAALLLTASALTSTALATEPEPSTTPPATGVSYTLTDTQKNLDVQLTTVQNDPANGRIYTLGTGEHGNDITYLTTPGPKASGTYWSLPADAPAGAVIHNMLLNKTGTKLYVVTKGSRKAGADLYIFDTVTGTPTHIGGAPGLATGMVENTTTGTVYLYKNAGLYRVDEASGSISAPIKFSSEKYPNVKDVVYDQRNQLFWIADAGLTKLALTAIDARTDTWLDAVDIKVTEEKMPDGSPIGGLPNLLALDENIGKLAVIIKPRTADAWSSNRLLQIDTVKRQVLPGVLEVGPEARRAVFAPGGELLISNASADYKNDKYTNLLTVANLGNGAVETAVDFDKAGVTSFEVKTADGTATTSQANVVELLPSADGNTLYVTHPYGYSQAVEPFSNLLTVLTRGGKLAEPTVTPEPGAGDGTEQPAEPEQPGDATGGNTELTLSDEWGGEKQPPAATVPAAARTISAAQLTWGVSQYGRDHAWAFTPYSSNVTKTGKDFTFTRGSGYVAADGSVRIAWPGALRIDHYSFVKVQSKWGNPVLEADASGKGTLTVEAWAGTGSLGTSSYDEQTAGYKRIPVITFTDLKIVEGSEGTTITLTPEWEGRSYEYQKNGETHTAANSWPAEMLAFYLESMRPWWYTSGSSADTDKAPLAPSISFQLAATQSSDGSTPGGETGGGDEAHPGTPTEPQPEQPKVQIAATSADDALATDGRITVRAGEKLHLRVSGLAGHSQVTVRLHSDPLLLGNLDVNTDGVAEGELLVPASAAAGSDHRLVVSAAGNELGEIAATVLAAADGAASAGDASSAGDGAAPAAGAGGGASSSAAAGQGGNQAAATPKSLAATGAEQSFLLLGVLLAATGVLAGACGAGARLRTGRRP